MSQKESSPVTRQLSVLKSNMEKRIVGKSELIDKLIIALVSEGHVLLEDVPGVGKTSLAQVLAGSLALSFARIQCTPDTTPADITGLSVYNSKDGEFRTVEGPVVNNIVLADELNRTSPKTQSALLEAMEERKVTIDGRDVAIPEPFMVIGTQNPIEMAGTYPLPESQLDRFMMRLKVGYPSSEDAVAMAGRFIEGSLHEETQQVLSGDDILSIRREVRKVTVHDNLLKYAVGIVEETRNASEVSCGASPRSMLSLLRCAQAAALYEGRDFCIPEDILKASLWTLPHRLVLSTEARMSRITQEQILKRITDRIKVPA